MSSRELSAELKALESREKEQLALQRQADSRVNEARKAARAEAARLAGIREQLATLKRRSASELIVTEHAMLRYLQRVRGVDLTEVAAAIFPSKVRDQVAELGDGLYPVDGFKVRVKGGVVVTVIGQWD